MLCRVKNIDYKDGKYDHYFEVHSPMGSMRLRAEDAAGKAAWISSLEKQAQVHVCPLCEVASVAVLLEKVKVSMKRRERERDVGFRRRALCLWQHEFVCFPLSTQNSCVEE